MSRQDHRMKFRVMSIEPVVVVKFWLWGIIMALWLTTENYRFRGLCFAGHTWPCWWWQPEYNITLRGIHPAYQIKVTGSFFYLHFRKSLPIREKGQIKLRKTYPSFWQFYFKIFRVAAGHTEVQISWAPEHFEVDFELGPSWASPPPRWTCSIRKTGKGIRRVKDVRHMHLWQQSSLQSYWLHQSCIHNIHTSSIKYTCLIRSSRLSIFSIRFLSSFSSWDPNQQGARSMSRRNHHVDQVASWVFGGNLCIWIDEGICRA